MRLLADRIRQQPRGQEFIDSWKANFAPAMNTIAGMIRQPSGAALVAGMFRDRQQQNGGNPRVYTGTVVDPNASFWNRPRTR